MSPLIFIVFVRLEYSPGRSVLARSLDGSILAARMLADRRLVQAGFTEQLDPLGFGHVGVWHNALLLLIGTGVG